MALTVRQVILSTMRKIEDKLERKGCDITSLQGEILNPLYEMGGPAVINIIKKTFDPYKIEKFLRAMGVPRSEAQRFSKKWNTQLVTHFLSKMFTQNKEELKYPKLFEGLKEAPVEKQDIVLKALGIDVDELTRKANYYTNLSMPPTRSHRTTDEELSRLNDQQRKIREDIAGMISRQYLRGKDQQVLRKYANRLRPMRINRTARRSGRHQ